MPSFLQILTPFERHFHLVNRANLETILKAEVFVNEVDNQVRVAHKILGHDPIQKSFLASKYVIKTKNPRLHKIIVMEHGFLLLEGSSTQRGVTLASSSLSYQAIEAKGVRAKSEE